MLYNSVQEWKVLGGGGWFIELQYVLWWGLGMAQSIFIAVIGSSSFVQIGNTLLAGV